jgi:hypothetical protein
LLTSKSMRCRYCHRLIFVTLSLFIAADLARANDLQQPPNSPEYVRYKEMVERARKGDVSVDFTELISAASDWDLSQKGIFTHPHREAMVEAFKQKKYQKAVEFAEIVLDYEFTNRGLHLATANAYGELAQTKKVNLHTDFANKILNALLSTGDGKSAETAYCVQSINEEYVIMRHFGYKVFRQAYMTSGGGVYDVLSGKDEKTGKEVGLYFDISGFFRKCVEGHQKKRN